MHGAETVLYSVFWATGLVVPSNGFRCRTHQWNMDLVGKDFCWTWKEINCASNPSNKDTRTFLQKQTLSNSYFNSKSGCCPILRKIHDSTQFLILIEMMDAWESLRWPFPGCCFSSPREVVRVARVVPALHSPRPRHYISHAPAAAGFRCSHERLTPRGAQRRVCIMNNGEMRCELVGDHTRRQYSSSVPSTVGHTDLSHPMKRRLWARMSPNHKVRYLLEKEFSSKQQ